jgi:predicted RNA-binding protein YlqC (UPF0109 family)
MTHDEKLDAAEELITQIARALVDHPDEVVVEAVEGDEGDDVSVLEMRVSPDDVGKVIGKQGRTVRSMMMIRTTKTRTKMASPTAASPRPPDRRAPASTHDP